MSRTKPADQDDRARAEEAPARGRGRPRSAEADHAILAATLRTIAAQGIAGVTMEGVAADAGVGKTTVYRRWASKTELVLAAVSQMTPQGDPPDTGSFWGDLQALSDAQLERVARTGMLTVAPRVLAEGMSDPELHQGFLDRVIEPIRNVIRTLIERAIERGELRDDLEVEPLVDLLHALPIYRIMVSRGDPAAIRPVRESYMPLLAAAISSSSAGRASARPRSSGSSRARRARSG